MNGFDALNVLTVIIGISIGVNWSLSHGGHNPVVGGIIGGFCGFLILLLWFCLYIYWEGRRPRCKNGCCMLSSTEHLSTFGYPASMEPELGFTLGCRCGDLYTKKQLARGRYKTMIVESNGNFLPYLMKEGLFRPWQPDNDGKPDNAPGLDHGNSREIPPL